MRQPAFFEATFNSGYYPSSEGYSWKDESTQDFFIFTSFFGTVKLRKRLAYPATFARSLGASLVFGYGSETVGHAVASQTLQEVSEELFTQEEFLYGHIDCARRSIIIQRDAMCVMPFFTMKQNGTVVMSNRYDRLFNQISKQQVHIDEAALVNYLLFDDRHRQLAVGADVLYDRARFVLRDGVTAIQYPRDAYIAEKASMEKVQPALFKQAIEATFDTYWQRYGAVGFQLSGGLDSATAPGYFAAQGKPVVAASFGLPAVMGERQQKKLDDMGRRFPLLQNHIIQLTPEEFFPFSDRVLAEYWDVSHEHQDMHQLAAARMADYFASRGITAMFTGVGGDELCQNITNDKIFPLGTEIMSARAGAVMPEYVTDKFRSLHAQVQSEATYAHNRPVPSVAYSVILTNIGFNNTFIDRNIWPVAPLADPRLFLYAQGIASWHRYDKGLLRVYQFARQFPESIVHPETLEDFSEFIHLCKPQLGGLLDVFFDNSVLSRQGLIDELSFKAYYRNVTGAPYDPEDTRSLELIRMLAAEINMRALRQ
jgi:hypothetical protein